MPKLQSYAVQTNYPKIYGATYWGAFNINSNPISDTIIQNRNEFISKYNISNIKTRPIKKIVDYISKLQNGNLLYDHIEVYITNDNKYLILNSPYGSSKENIEQFATKDGWIHIDNMYSDDTESFIKYIDKKKETYDNNEYLKKFYENLEEKIKICPICDECYSYQNHHNHMKTKYHRIAEKLANRMQQIKPIEFE